MLLAFAVVELLSKLDNLLDIRLDNQIDFKLSPVLLNNNMRTPRKFHANQLNVKEVNNAGCTDCYQNQLRSFLTS